MLHNRVLFNFYFSVKHFIVPAMLLCAVSVFAQSPKNRVLSIPVQRNGIWLREPWVGGMNAPQFSEADLNHDGIPDLFVFDRDGNVVLTYIGNGNGTDSMFRYAPQYETVFPAMQQYAMLRDYNNDGVPDIFSFVGSPAAGMEVFKGSILNGVLHYDLVSPALTYTIDTNYTPAIFTNYADIPVVTDVNRDGYLDILVYDVYGTFVGYYENQTGLHPGNPHYDVDSFQYIQASTCWGNFGQNPNSNAMMLNISCKGNAIDTLPATGNTRHSGNSLYNFFDPTYHTIDLLNGNIGYENLDFLQNCGDSVNANICVADSIFPLCDTPILMRDYPAAFGVDVNNDGLQDLLIAPNQTSDALDVNNVWYYKNTGDPSCLFSYQSDTFLTHNMLDFGTDSKGVFYDFNGDGLLDIVVGNYGYFVPSNPYRATLAIYLNTGTATQPQFTMLTEDYDSFASYGFQGVYPTFGDLNGDGKPDLIIGDATGYLSYFQNMGATGSSYPSMTAAQYFNITVQSSAAPFLFDVNDDSLLDLVVGNENGNLSYYWNFGTKTSPQFNPDSVNANFGNINVTVFPNSVGYSQPFIRKDSAGNMLLYVGSLAGPVQEFLIDTTQLRSGTFTRINSNVLGVKTGFNSTISIADINNDGKLEYLAGTSRGGLLLYSDSLWDPSTTPLAINNPLPPVQQLKIYPNPANDYVICTLPQGNFVNPQTEVFDVLGKKMNAPFTYNAKEININTSQLSNGIYLLRIIQSGQLFTGRFLIVK